MTPIDLSIFIKRVEAICQEMGIVLRQAAFSPNIKDRLDFSCALFDRHGDLFAQAAHIPVHLGSMAFAMRDIIADVRWQSGDVMVLNDPVLGGTHLPDVTLVSPFFVGDALLGFVVNRAHHANIGAVTPGSMPISRTLSEEGVVIPPTFLYRGGEADHTAMRIFDTLGGTEGDFAAQQSANRVGIERLAGLVATMGQTEFLTGISETNQYGEKLAKATLAEIPIGRYVSTDVMDDDGCGNSDVVIRCTIDITRDGISVDFNGTDQQVTGNINCPLSVAAAAVFYVFRCLMPEHTPACAGAFGAVRISAPPGCLVNARRPAAVAAGNVETSMRIVDVVLEALSAALPDRIPAASQGSMNNVAMGDHQSETPWDYYETIGGGSGGFPGTPGIDAVQSHMTNTLNTPIESLEMHYPVRISRYCIRRGSGGAGQFKGGDGLIREFRFLAPAAVTLLTERRRHPPPGSGDGAEPGLSGRNMLDDREIPGKCQLSIRSGQMLRIETPGGGGWSGTS